MKPKEQKRVTLTPGTGNKKGKPAEKQPGTGNRPVGMPKAAWVSFRNVLRGFTSR
jgi:hypothetical protein